MKSYFAYFVRNEAIENARKVFGKRVEPLPDSPWLLCAFLPDDEWNSGWVCVEGEPEDWEATLFGPRQRLGRVEFYL
jgi:hypothetical protein